MSRLPPGSVRIREASRRFEVVHQRNATLKETLIRGRRTQATELWAVRNITLDVHPGESVALVGRNGSGKSTLLKMLAGIIPPQKGRIDVGGSVASMLELGAGFHPDFTGRENVFMNGAIHGLSERDIRMRLDRIVEFAELPEFIDMPVRTYSSGMQMRLAFAIASHVNPDIMLLDEVLAVGDEAFQRKCMGRIHAFLHGGGTLIFVSHDAVAVERMCSRAILLDKGMVIADDRPPAVLEMYHRLLAEDVSDIGAAVVKAPAETTSSPADEDDAYAMGGWGTGAIEITGCRLLGEDGRPAERFVSGDTLRVEIELTAHADVEPPSVGISITTGDGTVCFGTNTFQSDFVLPRLDGSLSLIFEVADLALQEGQFEVTAAVHSQDDRVIYHWIDRVTAFSVFARHGGVGIAALNPRWIISESSQVQPPPFGAATTSIPHQAVQTPESLSSPQGLRQPPGSPQRGSRQ